MAKTHTLADLARATLTPVYGACLRKVPGATGTDSVQGYCRNSPLRLRLHLLRAEGTYAYSAAADFATDRC